MFIFDTDKDFIDKKYYPSLIEKQRSKALRECSHVCYIKKCSHCNQIIGSETTDKQNDMSQKREYEISELKNQIYLLEFILNTHFSYVKALRLYLKDKN